MKNGLGLLSVTTLIATLGATSAQAHSGVGIETGFFHPISGLDHLLALLTVGVLAGRTAGKTAWALPGLFFVFMAAGAAIALAGIAVSGTDATILASVAILAFVTAIALRPSAAISVLIAITLAVLHGATHVSAMAVSVSVGFVAGFLASTTLMIIAGVAVGKGLEALRAPHPASYTNKGI
ncbi:MAG: HupE/UreJ family protein [Pseudomonadota bacterium]|nr:HupE/UreJ family protein [Pseudomonadota bacterium]